MDRGGKRIAAVVDTNVIAYYLLGTSRFAAEAKQFWHRVAEPLAPSLWEAELANVMWMSVRAGVLTAQDAAAKLSFAARLGVHSVASRTLWHGALMRAVDAGIAAYDALFIELADREGVRLATFDQKLLKAYPRLAMRPRDLL